VFVVAIQRPGIAAATPTSGWWVGRALFAERALSGRDRVQESVGSLAITDRRLACRCALVALCG
jgi:hypothetical protein